MKNLKYKGYTGSIDYSQTDQMYFGKVLGIRSLIMYEGKTIEELTTDFEEAIDDYLLLCEDECVEPEIPKM